MDHAVQRAADLVHTKAALFQEARPLPEQDLKRFREPTDEALRIKPDDLWKVVAGKAISRCAIDPTAERFSRTAQFFSRALAQLHVKGGVYIYIYALENAGVVASACSRAIELRRPG